MNKVYIAIDNGVSGTIGIITEDLTDFMLTPVKKEQNYTKKKDLITRLDVEAFDKIISEYANIPCLIAMERPLVNPTMFKTTCCAVRCFESELTIIEKYKIPHIFIDSKEWQREMLPIGTKGTPELKKASVDVGCRLFPQCEKLIKSHKDADGILIAEFLRRKGY